MNTGVGLVIQESFLKRFKTIKDDDLCVVVRGRAVIMRLDGPEGSLDLVCVYMPTGCSPAA